MSVEPGPPCVLRCVGEIDLAGSEILGQGLGEACAAGDDVVVDLSGTSFMDSTGLGLLVKAAQQCERSGGSLALAGPNAMIRKVLDVTGLHRMFVVGETVDEAARALRDRRRPAGPRPAPHGS